ncbi:hypothetical protein GUITHDRAFT_156477 [Guillardia theta CCMP2712]|uniref:Uncharacterized protein n=1 Tax=Guillardia theta (strain CCMP2712) TaxID=905079 RepID=L1I6E6_GUITC|nr:hypothetical protein GUITHDRAFT_156477 [Guillardia theta CCMP2712]EKX31823.1 hypothetical protein GUITHDRAFT_156477 [Guillardia theta CCMP2712]|eukprot:XP_005818803.1 hypothetical protein GUITHDRAFT_156477 [Guillardia theta CCMP2712]
MSYPFSSAAVVPESCWGEERKQGQEEEEGEEEGEEMEKEKEQRLEEKPELVVLANSSDAFHRSRPCTG